MIAMIWPQCDHGEIIIAFVAMGREPYLPTRVAG